MRIASRHMPGYRPKQMGITAWLFLLALGGVGLYLLFNKPFASALVAALLSLAYLATRTRIKRNERTLRELAASREGQSICEFAQEFDLRTFDSWIVRAVYEQVQKQLIHIHPAFPLRGMDRLKEDLKLDDDDLDLDIAPEVEQRTGRSLSNASDNPYFCKVQTVRDLVLFFQSQKLNGAA
jgi:hypothetical protein